MNPAQLERLCEHLVKLREAHQGAVVVSAHLGSFDVLRLFAAQTGTLFPIFEVSTATVAMQAGLALAVGLGAALLPARRAMSVRIFDGLRTIG